MKIAIIGGGGRVGSNAAFALQCLNLTHEIALVDANAELAAGEALDLLHGASIVADQNIHASTLAQAADADIVCITAGSRRKPDESRLDLINRNVSIFKQILDELKTASLNPNAVFLVVSNPVDILTRMVVDYLGHSAQKVMGLGTVLDTARFRSMIAADRKLPATQVKALILGEHGDTMTPLWSSATVAGLPLAGMMSASEQKEIFEKTKGSGAEVIRQKGGAGYAVGLSIAEVVASIVEDRRQVLPVSTKIDGPYGIRDVCLSLPTVVGRAGVLGYVTPELWPKEKAGLMGSARALQQTWDKLA